MTEPLDIPVPLDAVNDTTVRVIALLRHSGERVEAGTRLAELETSKATVEVDVPVSGWVEVLCQAGEDLAVGSLIGRVHATADWRQSPNLVPVAPADAEVAAGPVFSKAAERLLAESGLDRRQFQPRSFVRAADVQARLGREAAPLQTPTAPAAVSEVADEALIDAPFEQHLGEGWNLKDLLSADLFRIDGARGSLALLKQWWSNPGFTYVFWFRVAQSARRRVLTRLLVYPLAVWRLRRCHFRFGIRIPLSVQAGPGLYIGHWGGIWVSPRCTLGANCSLGNDINLGSAGDGSGAAVPVIGDDVYLAPGCRVAGRVRVGQQAAVLANTVVTADVPAGAVVIGVPHRQLSRQERNRFVAHPVALER